MAKQINKAHFNITSFLENGALLQQSSDHFKLITGPFSPASLAVPSENPKTTLIYKPDFWDFLSGDRSSLSGSAGPSSAILNRNELLDLLEQGLPQRPDVAWQSVDTSGFKTQYDWSQQQFREGRLRKTVPIISQNGRAKFTVQNLAAALKNLLSEIHFGWAYGCWQKGSGFLGQTPELLVEWKPENQELTTAALAGTVKNISGNERVIMNDAKIREEHQFVVADIIQNLNKVFNPTQIQRDENKVLTLKHLLHLKTDFRCVGVDFALACRTIQALHPTAALGVYPRDPEMMKTFSQISLQNERRSFAAPFAFIEKAHVLAVAVIRNFYFSPEQVMIISGAGVTAESTYESELTELEIKREAVKRMMGLAQ